MTPWFVRILAGIAGGALWAAPAVACDLPAGETAGGVHSRREDA
jgi:hypothetical protein